MKKLNGLAVLAVVSVLGLIGLAGTSDYQDEIDQQKRYCEMVKEWNDHAHLPEEDRPGWPPYNGEEQCHED